MVLALHLNRSGDFSLVAVLIGLALAATDARLLVSVHLDDGQLASLALAGRVRLPGTIFLEAVQFYLAVSLLRVDLLSLISVHLTGGGAISLLWNLDDFLGQERPSWDSLHVR